MRRKIYSFGLIIMLIVSMLPSTKVSAKASDGTVTIEGLENGDTVEIYQICTYADGVYSFASAVKTWINTTDDGMEYAELTPTGLSSLNSETSHRFCENLLMGLKNDTKGIANLSGKTFIKTEENSVVLDPGYYVILPKGKERIYDLKWFILEPAGSINLVYSADNYTTPSISSNSESDEERGLIREGILDEEAEEDLRPAHLLVNLDDEITVTSNMTFPQYTDMYSSGKRIMNVALIIPYGMDYVDNSLEILGASSNNALGEINEDAYAKQQFDKAIIYETLSGEMLFFGQGDYYYEMDGSRLSGPDSDPKDALATYNSSHNTEYVLQDENIVMIDDVIDENDETDPDDGEDSSDGVIEPDDLEPDELIDPTVTVKENKECTIIVLSVDTNANIASLQTTYRAVKNKYSSENGWYDLITALSYSVSPLDSNLHHTMLNVARVGSYGIRITACKGEYNSYEKTNEELLNEAIRMSEDSFGIYKKNNVYEGNTTNAEDSASEEGAKSIQLIYDQESDTTTEYLLLAELSVDGKGQISMGGIAPEEYLIVQLEKSAGYSLSNLSLRIETEDWENEELMEGNALFDIVWLDYKTVFLPATGSNGSDDMRVFAILIMAFIALISADIYRKRRKFH